MRPLTCLDTLSSVLPIIYYARGADLGHLARANAFIHDHFAGEAVTLIGDSRFASLARPSLGPKVDFIDLRSASRQRRVTSLIAERAPDLLVMDAFPCGIHGEVTGPQPCPVWHVARLLKWRAYLPLVDPRCQFDRTPVLETLTGENMAFLEQASKVLESCRLSAPTTMARADSARSLTPRTLDELAFQRDRAHPARSRGIEPDCVCRGHRIARPHQ